MHYVGEGLVFEGLTSQLWHSFNVIINCKHLYFRSKLQSFFLVGVGKSKMSLNRQLKFLTYELKLLEDGIKIGDVTIKANLIAYTGNV